MAVKITDLVEQTAIDRIKELDGELKGLVATYTETAKEFAKGIDINVKIVGDLDKLETLLVERSKEAATVNGRLNQVVTEQNQIIANTSNTLSRHLMEQERVNKSQREAYTDTEKFKALMERVNGSYEQRVQRLVQLEKEIKDAKARESELSKEFEKGTIDQKHYTEIMTELRIGTRALMQEKADLTTHLKNEEREMQSVEGSYRNQSQRLELMKKAYKDLTDEERNSPLGREMEAAIQNLDAHLKDVAADMGEFQRNVGNYAIAGQKGVATTESVVAAMNQEARTTQDLIDQTRILEEAKVMLNKSDGNYQKTLAALNSKIDENKRKLSDVSDILHKDATSVAEAESQNKRLKEALKQVDLSSDGAQKRIKELNDKIAKNTKLIKQNTPAMGELAGSQTKASKSLGGFLGLNSKFTSSLGLSGKGISALTSNTNAFANTILSVLSNLPQLIALLGITGLGAAVKWIYNYNSNIAEATRLTKEFLGLSGDNLKSFRAEMAGVAETFDKDYKEVLQGVDTLTANMGISCHESLQIIKDGFVSGADVSGDFLAKIQRYAPAFHDAGISADEFVAIVTQTRSGIFGDKGLEAIKIAVNRIRSMEPATAKAIDAIGLSSEAIKKGLDENTLSIMDVIQQVSGKLNELPDNSQKVGNALSEVFGRKGPDAGLQMIRSLADLNTNLQDVKDETGELGKLQEEQMESQIELEKTLAAVFDKTGGDFETLKTKCKTYINDGLILMIKYIVDIANWWIKMYNQSVVVRYGVLGIVNGFKLMWVVSKSILNRVVNSFKAMGDVVEGMLDMNWEKVESGWKKGLDALKDDFKATINEAYKTYNDSFNTLKKPKEVEYLTYELHTENRTSTTVKNQNNNTDDDNTTNDDKGGKRSDKETLDRARELAKNLEALEEAKINMMEDTHEKEIKMIQLKFKKKLAEIKGNSKEEHELRVLLMEEMQKEIGACEEKYQRELSKINLENRLAAVEEGSKEELDLKLAQLEANRDAELEAAKKTGADVSLINAKFDKQRLEMEQDYTANQAEEIMNRYAVEEMTREQAYSKAVNALKERYAKELALAGGNKEKQEKLKKELEDNLSKLQEDYSLNTAQSSIDMINEVLKLDNMSAKDRLKWEQELAKAQMDLDNQIADAHAKSVEKQMDDDDKLREKRKANLSQWLQIASDSISNISELVNTLFDGQIQKIEEEQEANQEAGDQEQERISQLVEKKVITEEEGEARKRAAEAQTAKKNEELEKKKAALLRKQAIFQKATDLAQAGIATALAVTQALPNLVLAAIAGAMGAINIATIAATPIPKYAKGTDYHPGGPAIVGDGGRPEVISFNGSAWLTPDKPTLLDIPTGATVYPDVIEYVDNPLAKMVIVPDSTPKIKPYDDSGVRNLLREFINAVKAQTKQHHRDMMDAKYEEYKKRI